jgi:hypothetical protein
MMTERERVLTLLAGGRGEKPPGFKESDAYIAWHRELGVGFYLQGYFPFRAVVEGGP